MKQVIVAAVVIAFLFISCKEEYDPPVTSMPNSLLVVEANLDPSGATSIKLTKTFKLDANATVTSENNAQVTVEGKDNTVRNLVFSGNGNYTSPSLNLIIGNEYRLRIKTTAGKEYVSAYVKARKTPDIDSLSWDRDNEGIHVYVNTHDPSNATTYYNWRYEETWEQHSPFGPDYIYQNGSIRQRIFPQENVSYCWKTTFSSQILLANSTRLGSDVINRAPLLLIPKGDEKVLFRYSVLAKQYALDKDAYSFLELMKKNTEDIGSFFGPMPSEVKGNISCITNPNELVIGFVTASTVTEKRIFIEAYQVLNWPFYFPCDELRVPNSASAIQNAIVSGYMVVTFLGSPPNEYVFSKPICVDCTLRGGTTVRPSFW